MRFDATNHKIALKRNIFAFPVYADYISFLLSDRIFFIERRLSYKTAKYRSLFNKMFSIPYIVQFWALIISDTLMILCLLFVLYQFLFDQTLRQNLNNYVNIIVLIVCFIEGIVVLPLLIHYYRINGDWIRSKLLCQVVVLLDWANYIIIGMLVAWLNVERHILIFHRNWVSTFKKRLFIHYCPPILLIAYCFTFYGVFVFSPPCTNTVNQLSGYCMTLCIQSNYLYTLWETFIHFVLPSVTIVLSSIGLLIRVIRRKYRIHRRVQWQQHRKMAVQTLLISLIYIIFGLPFVITNLLYSIGIWNDVLSISYTITSFLCYFTCFPFPFICALSIPDVKQRIRKIFCFKRQNIAIRPIATTLQLK